MVKADVREFMREYRIVVGTTVSPSGVPQAAAVGVLVTDALEVLFDTLEETRKFRNLKSNPAIAFVFGGTAPGEERTVQYEGVADVPTGSELEALKQAYFHSFPDGRDRLSWPGIVYVRVRPRWLRYSDYRQTPPEIVEFDFAERDISS